MFFQRPIHSRVWRLGKRGSCDSWMGWANPPMYPFFGPGVTCCARVASESLPLVSPTALHPDMGDMGAVSELVGSYQRYWMEFKDRHWRQPKEPANPHASLHVPHASLYGLLRSCLTRVAASVILCACCAVRCEGEAPERIPSIL